MVDERQATPLYQLLLRGRRERLPKRQIVSGFEDKTLLHLIRVGYIKRYRIQNDGTRKIQVIYGPGDIVPLSPVYKTLFDRPIYRGPETYFYEAMTEVELYTISHVVLKEAVEANPLLYRDLLLSAGDRLNSFIQRLEDASISGSHRRVAHLLAYLSDMFGTITDEGTLINLPLSQQTISEILGLARETVTHSITNLREKNLISVTTKKVTVLDREKLLREAYN